MQQSRVIFYHKQSTSARTRFLRFHYHAVCAFEPLPKLAMLMDEDETPDVVLHPAMVIKQAEQQFGLSTGELEAEAEYNACVDVAGGPVNVLLARFTSIDPPFALAEKIDAKFIDLTEARDLTEVELALLRRAYELILGG
jgi:hypothetical protein